MVKFADKKFIAKLIIKVFNRALILTEDFYLTFIKHLLRNILQICLPHDVHLYIIDHSYNSWFEINKLNLSLYYYYLFVLFAANVFRISLKRYNYEMHFIWTYTKSNIEKWPETIIWIPQNVTKSSLNVIISFFQY